MTDTLRFKDFSGSPEPITFRIEPDTFRCYPEIPLDVMMEIAATQTSKELTGVQRFEQFMGILGGVIVAEDYDAFMGRTRKGTLDKPNPYPIGLSHIRDLIPWIMEVYGLRPTQESSESADGSEPDDTSSTEHASDEALIS